MTPHALLNSLASIAENRQDAWPVHGIVRVDPVAPAGHYQRRPAVYADLTHLLPHESIARLHLDNHYQAYGALSRYVLRDAVVTDQGAVLTAGGALVEESCWEFLVHGHVPFGLQRQDDDTRFGVHEAVSRVVDAPTLLVKRPWWRNYGHFLVDAAALLALLRRRGVGGFDQILIGEADDPKLRAVMRETLDRVAPGVPVLEQDDRSFWRFSELHYMQPVRRPPMFTLPDAVEALRAALLGDEPPPTPRRRIFVSRGLHARRRLENEKAVQAAFARYGFEIVAPERLDVAGQAALFRSASAIAGVKGAALTNLIFAPNDATVIALSPGDFSDPFFLDIATARGLAYAEMFGSLASSNDLPALNPFTIELPRLEAMLRAVLPEAAPSVAAAPPPVVGPPISGSAAVASRPNKFPAALQGDDYISCLARFHEILRPRSYLEIGTLAGATLALARCRAVAVDPAPRLEIALPGRMPSLFLFQGTSDAFFAEVAVEAVLGGKVDLAFLDGMHLFEYLLRDFINTERHCHPGSVVLLHDCVPLDAEMTGRDMKAVQTRPSARYPGWWTGDVWKTVDVLLQWRPDLDIVALDAPPTGLVAIRNLDPASTVLETDYAAILDEYRDHSAPADFAAYFARLPMRPTTLIDTFQPIHPASSAAA